MSESLQRVRAAIIDGRARAPRYIQKQLSTLHNALVQELSNLYQAVIKDTGYTPTEAWFEINMTIQSVKDQYEAINFEDCLQEEYSIAEGKSNANRRVPFGCVYIVPYQHNRLYSLIQPAVAAIAAGNCVIIEMSDNPLAVDKIIRDMIQPKMDKDTFVIVDHRPANDQLSLGQTVFLGSNERDSSARSFSKMLRTPLSGTIAVVDRSADISAAARTIVRSRIHFNGKSCYAPDVVLVNEFAVKDFCKAAVKSLTEDLSTTEDSNPSSLQASKTSKTSSFEATYKTLISTARGSIELLSNRDASISIRKLDEPRLLIVPISSLDDAIDFANNEPSPLLAAYFFADTKAAKYLSQFIVSNLSLTNSIPSQLLVGPPAPQDYPASFNARFVTEMFSFPSPEIVAPSSTKKSSAKDGNSLETSVMDQATVPKAVLEKLKASIRTPLSDMGQPSGKSIGFFEQGLFTGLAVHCVVAVTFIAVTAKYAIPAISRRL